MGSWFCRDSVFICLLLPENMIICDKCMSKCGKRVKLNDLRFYYILRFFLHFALYRVNAKCNVITFCVVTALLKIIKTSNYMFVILSLFYVFGSLT